jgi:hypothetical protein
LARGNHSSFFIHEANPESALPTNHRNGTGSSSFLLRDLAREPKDWFWALYSVTGANPVAAQDEGDIAAMSKAWLDWGRQRGTI